MTHRTKLTNETPSRYDYASDPNFVYLYNPLLFRNQPTVGLNHAEARALLRLLAERYPGEVEALVAEWGESRRAALMTIAESARRDERWCSWCDKPVPLYEDYPTHLARHI